MHHALGITTDFRFQTIDREIQFFGQFPGQVFIQWALVNRTHKFKVLPAANTLLDVKLLRQISQLIATVGGAIVLPENFNLTAGSGSYQVEDYERAWEQAIIAARAGIDMRDVVASLRNTTTPPANWLERIEAPLVYVDPADVSGVLQARTYGFNQQRVGGQDAPSSDMDASARGISTQLTNNDIPFDLTQGAGGNTSAADWNETGARKIQNNYKQISEMMRRFREGVAHGTYFGLASSPEAAAYHVRIEIIELAGEMSGRLVGCELLPDQEGNLEDSDVDTDVYEAIHPKRLDGNISLINRSGEKVYQERLLMDDISSLADLHNRIDRYIQAMEAVVGQ